MCAPKPFVLGGGWWWMWSSFRELFHSLVRGLPGRPSLGYCDLPGSVENVGEILGLVRPGRVPLRGRTGHPGYDFDKKHSESWSGFLKRFFRLAAAASGSTRLFASPSFPRKCLPRQKLSWIGRLTAASRAGTASVSVASVEQTQAPGRFSLLGFVSQLGRKASSLDVLGYLSPSAPA